MIYTLTANPAIDYNISCDGLSANTVTRTRNAVYTPNGKGLNVSFTLDHYGVDTTILGFFAGFSGEFIVKGAEALGVPVKPVWTDGITRVNVFLNAGPDTEYNMVNAGAAINATNEQEMFELIDSLDDMTCLVISGSLPPNTSEGFLAEVLRRGLGRLCHTDKKAASEESPAQTVDSTLTSKVRLANQMCSPLEKYAPSPPRVSSTFLAPLACSSAIAALTDSSSPPLTLMPKMSSSSSSLGLMSNGSMAMRSAS